MSAQSTEFYLSKLSEESEDPAVSAGSSGYFSAPETTLDPKIFEGKRMLPEVRSWVLTTVYDFWATKYNGAHHWSTVWAAGSGISYQWAAARGNGDLDILIGVDFTKFFTYNPMYSGLSEKDMANHFNVQFHDELWPLTAAWNGFEVTFFVNEGAQDIRDIHPYAAYNITHDTWTVSPPKLPPEPRTRYPQIYWDAVNREKEQVNKLVVEYKMHHLQSQLSAPGSAHWLNSISAQRAVVNRATALFDDIHLGRRNAFGPDGEGYGDYYNFRWQAHKEAGTIDALRTLKSLHDKATVAAQEATYGQRLDATDAMITRAALWNQHG